MGEKRETSEEDLEKRIEDKYNKSKNPSRFKRYVVDTTSSWLFWTPLMTTTEAISGMEADEILSSRLTAISLALVVARPYGMFRQYWADLWNADAMSSSKSKFLVDSSAHFCFQLPVYSAILYASGTSLDEGIAALGTGLTMGFIAGRPFGYFQDKWRKMWGTKTTLE